LPSFFGAKSASCPVFSPVVGSNVAPHTRPVLHMATLPVAARHAHASPSPSALLAAGRDARINAIPTNRRAPPPRLSPYRSIPTQRRGAFVRTDAGRGAARFGKSSEEYWDPDEQRRVNENKSWKRTDAPEDAWDIDKERDATMYKRESLERLLSLTPSEAKPDKTVVCNKCRAPVSKRSLETQKDRAHLHRLYYADKYVAVGIYQRDGTTVDVDASIDQRASRWWAPRAARRCKCGGCGEVLGWAFEDNAEEKVGPFYALLASRLATNEGGGAGSEE
jgi:hypothetical protein